MNFDLLWIISIKGDKLWHYSDANYDKRKVLKVPFVLQWFISLHMCLLALTLQSFYNFFSLPHHGYSFSGHMCSGFIQQKLDLRSTGHWSLNSPFTTKTQEPCRSRSCIDVKKKRRSCINIIYNSFKIIFQHLYLLDLDSLNTNRKYKER